jgi:hypothetical protein
MDMLAGTLVDRVVEYRNREDARNGIDLDAQAHQFNSRKLPKPISTRTRKESLPAYWHLLVFMLLDQMCLYLHW